MWEEEGRLIPTILSSYHEKTPPKLSSPSTVRDFVFIDDVCDAYLCIIKNAEIAAGKIYNVAGGKGVSIGEVVLCVQSLTGSRIEPVYGAVQGRAFDTNRWEGDTSLLRALGWAPRHELSEGLMKMISFKWGEPAITRMSDPKRQGGA
jgi:dolichol-phosphate mannosyltransferase